MQKDPTSRLVHPIRLTEGRPIEISARNAKPFPPLRHSRCIP